RFPTTDEMAAAIRRAQGGLSGPTWVPAVTVQRQADATLDLQSEITSTAVRGATKEGPRQTQVGPGSPSLPPKGTRSRSIAVGAAGVLALGVAAWLVARRPEPPTAAVPTATATTMVASVTPTTTAPATTTPPASEARPTPSGSGADHRLSTK